MRVKEETGKMDNKAMAFVVTLTQSGPDEIRERTIVVYTMNDNYVMEMIVEEMRSEQWVWIVCDASGGWQPRVKALPAQVERGPPMSG
jgi:hypothetical protein